MSQTADEAIGVVEALIGLHFPDEHRRLLLQHDGWSTTYGDDELRFLSVEEIREHYLRALHDASQDLVDFIPFAREGDRLVGYDRRVEPSPVVMVDRTATDWSAAKLQGFSFAGFLGRLVGGKGIDDGTTYAGPPT